MTKEVKPFFSSNENSTLSYAFHALAYVCFLNHHSSYLMMTEVVCNIHLFCFVQKPLTVEDCELQVHVFVHIFLFVFSVLLKERLN